ncbi:MAG TPA: PAS domain S-box protein [Chloroflexota bacterium]|nr:PAS domain S-box protein [Chloroflexota bacterium]
MAVADRAVRRSSFDAARVLVPRFALPPVLTALATVGALQFVRVVGGEPPYALFYAAVALSAWYGGLGPGLLATVLSGMAIDYYLQEPRFSIAVTSAPEGFRLLAFAMVALLIGLLQARARAAAERAQRGELSAQQLAAIVASSDDAIVGLDLNGEVTSWNAGAEALLGHQASDVIGRPISALAAAPWQTEIPKALAQLQAGGRLGHYETVWTDRTGRPLAMSVTLSPVRDANGQVVGASAIARDVTRRKQAEEAHARLAAIIASSSEAIVGADADGVVSSWNPGARRLFGYHAAEVTGRRLAELVVAEDRERWEAAVGRARGGEDAAQETFRLTHREGRVVEAAIVVSPVHDAGERVVGLSLVGRPAAPEGGGPRWRVLAEATRSWSQGEAPERVLATVVRGARRAIDADAASVMRWDAAEGVLVVPPGVDAPADAGSRFAALGATARAIAGRVPVVVNDYQAAPDATPEAIAAGVQAAVAVPVLDRGAVVGVFQATVRRPDRRFRAEDAQLLELLAPVAAACLRELPAG